METLLSECRLPSGWKLTPRLKQLPQALALPEDAGTYLLEISKFLATGALILATAVVLLMVG